VHRAYLHSADITFMKARRSQRLHELVVEFVQEQTPKYVLSMVLLYASPMSAVLSALLEWREQSPYATDLDFLFPSVRFKGNKPLSPDSILEKSIRPALAKIGVVGKQIGWHSFGHSLATNLRSLSVDIKVAQELMRHSSCRTTLDVYTCAVDQQKRETSLKVIELMLPLEMEKFQHPFAPSARLKAIA